MQYSIQKLTDELGDLLGLFEGLEVGDLLGLFEGLEVGYSMICDETFSMSNHCTVTSHSNDKFEIYMILTDEVGDLLGLFEGLEVGDLLGLVEGLEVGYSMIMG